VWSYEPCIHLVVDLARSRTSRRTRSTASPSGCWSICRGSTSTIARGGKRGGFVERLTEGTWLGHIAEHVALQLQQEAGHDLRRGKTRQVKACAAGTTSSTRTPRNTSAGGR
jgi:cyanophycin synthetase